MGEEIVDQPIITSDPANPRRKLIAELVKNYEPEADITEDYINNVEKHYGEDTDRMISELVKTYEPEANIDQAYLDAAYQHYGLKKKEVSGSGSPIPGGPSGPNGAGNFFDDWKAGLVQDTGQNVLPEVKITPDAEQQQQAPAPFNPDTYMAENRYFQDENNPYQSIQPNVNEQTHDRSEPTTWQKADTTLGAFNRAVVEVAPATLETIAIVSNFLDNDAKEVKDYATSKGAKWMRDQIEYLFPVNKAYQEELAPQIASGLGMIVPMILAAPSQGATILSKAPQAGSALLAASKQAASHLASRSAAIAGVQVGTSEFKQAKDKGASDEVAFEAYLKNAVVGGVLENIPVAAALKRLNKATGGGVVNWMKKTTVNSLEETATEVLQQMYSNVNAAQTYDKTKRLMDGTLMAGEAGFGTGFILNGIMNALGAKAKTARNQTDKSQIERTINYVKAQEQKFFEPGSTVELSTDTQQPAPAAQADQLQAELSEADIDSFAQSLKENEQSEQAPAEQQAQPELESNQVGPGAGTQQSLAPDAAAEPVGEGVGLPDGNLQEVEDTTDYEANFVDDGDLPPALPATPEDIKAEIGLLQQKLENEPDPNEAAVIQGQIKELEAQLPAPEPEPVQAPAAAQEVVAEPVSIIITSGKNQISYDVVADGPGHKVINPKTKVELKPGTPNYNAAVAAYRRQDTGNKRQQVIDNPDTGKRITPNEGMNPEQYNRQVAEESENAQEIAQAFLDEPAESGLSAKEKAIKDNLSKFPQKSYARFGDMNNLQGQSQKRLHYFNDSGLPMDVQAQKISEISGMEVTEQDIFEFVERYPNGKWTAKGSGSKYRDMLAARFEQVTGVPLNEGLAGELTKPKEQLKTLAVDAEVSDYLSRNPQADTYVKEFLDEEGNLHEDGWLASLEENGPDGTAFVYDLTEDAFNELKELLNERRQRAQIASIDERSNADERTDSGSGTESRRQESQTEPGPEPKSEVTGLPNLLPSSKVNPNSSAKTGIFLNKTAHAKVAEGLTVIGGLKKFLPKYISRKKRDIPGSNNEYEDLSETQVNDIYNSLIDSIDKSKDNAFFFQDELIGLRAFLEVVGTSTAKIISQELSPIIELINENDSKRDKNNIPVTDLDYRSQYKDLDLFSLKGRDLYNSFTSPTNQLITFEPEIIEQAKSVNLKDGSTIKEKVDKLFADGYNKLGTSGTRTYLENAAGDKKLLGSTRVEKEYAQRLSDNQPKQTSAPISAKSSGLNQRKKRPSITVDKVGNTYIAPDGTEFKGKGIRVLAEEYANTASFIGARIKNLGSVHSRGQIDVVENVEIRGNDIVVTVRNEASGEVSSGAAFNPDPHKVVEWGDGPKGKPAAEPSSKLKGEAKRKAKGEDKVVDFLNSIKIDTKNTAQAFGIVPALYNASLDVMIVAYKGGKAIAEAVQAAIDHVNATMPAGTTFDEKGFRGKITKDFEKFEKDMRERAQNSLAPRMGNVEEKMFGSKTKTDADFVSSKPSLPKILGLLSMAQEKTVAKWSRQAGNAVSKFALKKAATGGDFARNVVVALGNVFAGFEIPDALRAQQEMFSGKARSRAVADARKISEGLRKTLIADPTLPKPMQDEAARESLKRIDQVLDPEFHKHRTKDGFLALLEEQLGDTKFQKLTDAEKDQAYQDYEDSRGTYTPITIADLTDQEKAVHDSIREIYDLIHDMNFAMGKIGFGTYLKNKGTYVARMYDVFELPEGIDQMIQESASSMSLGMYKKQGEVDLWKLTQKVEDPVYLMTKRLHQTLVNKAVFDYAQYIANDQSHLVSTGERPGYTKLGRGYGALSDKFVLNRIAEDFKGYFWATGAIQKAYEFMKWYDGTDIRQFYKSFFTVYNPAVNIGNVTGNVVFSMWAGIDPASLATKVFRFSIQEMSDYGPSYRYLLNKGVLNTSILSSELKEDLKKFKNAFDEGEGKKNPYEYMRHLLRNNKIKDFYSGVDDAFKLAAFQILTEQGMSAPDAANKVANGFQNSKRTAKVYDFAARTPIFGNPFVRFASDLFRILQTTIRERPLHMAAFGASLHLAGYIAQAMSGESDEEKEVRESRPGFPRISLPDWLGGKIPLAWKVFPDEMVNGKLEPGNELNLARFISPIFIYSNVDEDGDTGALLNKFLPYQYEPAIEKTSNPAGPFAVQFSKIVKDPMFAWLQLVADADFRGQSISDRDATTFKPSTNNYNQDLVNERIQNQIKFLIRAYGTPYASNVMDFVAALNGDPDYYGRDRTPQQALMRFLGQRVEQFGPEQYQKVLLKSVSSEAFLFKDNAKKTYNVLKGMSEAQTGINDAQRGIKEGIIKEKEGKRKIEEGIRRIEEGKKRLAGLIEEKIEILGKAEAKIKKTANYLKSKEIKKLRE